MRYLQFLPAFVAIASAAPRPQDIQFDIVDAADDPVIVTPAVAVASQTASIANIEVQTSLAAAAVSSAPAAPASDDSQNTAKRDLEKRDGNCAKQPAGKGPVASPDTPSAFLSNTNLWVRLGQTESSLTTFADPGQELQHKSRHSLWIFSRSQ